MRLLLVISNFLLSILLSFSVLVHEYKEVSVPTQQIVENKKEISFEGKKTPVELKYHTTVKDGYPDFLYYNEIVSKLKEWNQEASDITEIGTYGKSSQGKDLYYIKIHSPSLSIKSKPIFLIACIHGNESLATSTLMWHTGNLLKNYDNDRRIQKILEMREIYVIPVVSPDSFPHSRYVDGVDPNRNFPTRNNPNRQSIPPIQALRDFALKIKPKALLSFHTYGRLYLYPWGDTHNKCPHDKEYRELLSQMADLSDYRILKSSELYRRPIYGDETDWFYRQGAFAIVAELGTHQRIPTRREIEHEFNRTKDAIMLFLERAPDMIQ